MRGVGARGPTCDWREKSLLCRDDSAILSIFQTDGTLSSGPAGVSSCDLGLISFFSLGRHFISVPFPGKVIEGVLKPVLMQTSGWCGEAAIK